MRHTTKRWAALGVAVLILTSTRGRAQEHAPLHGARHSADMTSFDYPKNAQSPHLPDRVHYYHQAPVKPRAGCYTTFNDYSCTNIHATTDFIFGSCRKFFGELCLKAPPPDPIAVYRYNQRLYPHTGDHTVPGSRMLPVYGATPETQAPPPLPKEYTQKRPGLLKRLFGDCGCDE